MLTDMTAEIAAAMQMAVGKLSPILRTRLNYQAEINSFESPLEEAFAIWWEATAFYLAWQKKPASD